MDTGNSQPPMELEKSAAMASTALLNEKPSRKRSRSPEDTARSRNERGPKKHRSDNRRDRGNHSSRGRGHWEKSIHKVSDAGKGLKNRRDRPDNEANSAKDDGSKPIYSVEFSKEEIAEEERRPKRKVAVMIGYCGSGYSGLQVMQTVKTIEGDIFGAFVAAGAISKANADEPHKVQLVRCARTDKGVHAAGNVLSLKLIIEDEDIVEKINEHLPPQIRVWGIEQTVNSFNAYKLCDSRIYEYLIPSHCFLAPHPRTFLAQKLEEFAVEANDLENYKIRQEDVSNFWAETEEKYVKPVLEAMDPELREPALASVFLSDETHTGNRSHAIKKHADPVPDSTATKNQEAEDKTQPSKTKSSNQAPLDLAIRSIKAAHQQAKLAYRISPARLARVKSTLSRYVGTARYHNFTVDKRADDPSCKRHIKSFVVHGEPFLIGDTEWLSLKVHGQSFMMHQIRKMITMAAMVVRCGTHEARIQDAFERGRITIPRAPALGLLLERPIFDAYNKFGRQKSNPVKRDLQFDRYEKEMQAFKQKEIYERMYADEAEQQNFANFFGGLDSLRDSSMLWATSLGLEALNKKDIEGVVAGERVWEGEEEEVAPGAEEG